MNDRKKEEYKERQRKQAKNKLEKRKNYMKSNEKT
jgi:hypothetical protein